MAVEAAKVQLSSGPAARLDLHRLTGGPNPLVRREVFEQLGGFDTAYKAIMQCALIGLHANGYRPATSTPGHHQTMIQCLPLTLDVSNDGWLVLDALRKKRNANDYLGDLIERESMFECIRQADSLLARTRKWLAEHRPDLMDGGKRP